MTDGQRSHLHTLYRELLLLGLATGYLFLVLALYRIGSRLLPDDLWLDLGNPLATLALVRLLLTALLAVLAGLALLGLLRWLQLPLEGEERFRLGIVAGTLLLLVETRWQETIFPGWFTLLRAAIVAALPFLLGCCRLARSDRAA